MLARKVGSYIRKKPYGFEPKQPNSGVVMENAIMWPWYDKV